MINETQTLAINPAFRERIGTVSTPYISKDMYWSKGFDRGKLLKEENEQMGRFLAEGKQIICFTADCCSGIFTPKPRHLIEAISKLEHPAAAYMYCMPQCERSAKNEFLQEVNPYLKNFPKSSAFVLGEYLSTSPGISCAAERNFESAFNQLKFDEKGSLIDPWSSNGMGRTRFYIHKPTGLTDLDVFRKLLS